MVNIPENQADNEESPFDAAALFRIMEQPGKPDSREEDAQQLFYDAMEAPLEEEKFELIQGVLDLDSGNVDALLVARQYCALDDAEEIAVLRRIVALAEERLGPKTFAEFSGAFWGFLETRPYMRAREQLAEILRAAGQIEEAVAEWEALIELNPSDNQGVRYALLSSYLALKQLDRAERLFEQYDEGAYHTVFAWGKVLERVLSEDLPGPEKALAVARKQNPHTEAYVKGRKRLPQQLPDNYSPGSETEAICFAEGIVMAWKAHPEARRWLETNS